MIAQFNNLTCHMHVHVYTCHMHVVWQQTHGAVVEEEHAQPHVSTVNNDLTREEQTRLDHQSQVTQKRPISTLKDGHLVKGIAVHVHT